MKVKNIVKKSAKSSTVKSTKQITSKNAVNVVKYQIVHVIKVVTYTVRIVQKTINEQLNRLNRITILIKTTIRYLHQAQAKHDKAKTAKYVKKLVACKRNKKDSNAKLRVAQAQKKLASVGLAKAKSAKKSVAKKVA